MRINLRKGSQRYEILDLQESHSGDTLKAFRNKSAALNFLRGFSRDPLNITSLRKFLVRGFAHSGRRRLPDHKVLEQIAWRLASGQLKIAVLPVAIPTWAYEPLAVEEEILEPATPAVVGEKTSWIEVQLVDEEDTPISETKYRIKLPDGSTKEGLTDSQGQLRLEGIEAGTCKISFPDLGAS